MTAYFNHKGFKQEMSCELSLEEWTGLTETEAG